MALLYHPSLDPSRVYYGTDTRAFELLVGAALAMVWPSRRLSRAASPPAPAASLDGLGVVGLLAIAFMVWRTNEYSPVPLPRRVRRCSSLATVLVARRRSPTRPAGSARSLGWRAAALDRGALLRHLPLALPDHRPHHPGRAPTASTSSATRSRWRRPSSSRRSPGASSRSRSATARSAASWRAASGRRDGARRRSRGAAGRSSPGSAAVLVARLRRAGGRRARAPPPRRVTARVSRTARSGATQSAAADRRGEASARPSTPPAAPSSTSATRPRRA